MHLNIGTRQMLVASMALEKRILEELLVKVSYHKLTAADAHVLRSVSEVYESETCSRQGPTMPSEGATNYCHYTCDSLNHYNHNLHTT